MGHRGTLRERRDERSPRGHDGASEAFVEGVGGGRRGGLSDLAEGLGTLVERSRETSLRTPGGRLRGEISMALEGCPWGTAGLSADLQNGPSEGLARSLSRGL